MFATGRIKELLLSGRFRELEDHLLKRCLKSSRHCTHLVHLYLETQQYSKALDLAERLCSLNPSPYSTYLYLLASHKSGREPTAERRRLSKMVGRDSRALYHMYLGILYLLEGELEKAERRFKSASSSGLTMAHWGLAEVLRQQNKIEEARGHSRLALKESGQFPPVLLQAGILSASTFRAVFYLWRYLRLVPISSEGNYELGMRLLELSGLPSVGWLFRRKALEALQIKALLDPPKPENGWLYRLMALEYARMGRMDKAARWILIEQQVLYNTLSNLEKGVKREKQLENEEFVDMIHSVVKLLVERDIITEEEFERAYAERRETRLLEKMYQMSSEDEDEQG